MNELQQALTTHTLQEIAGALGVCTGTIARWKQLQHVPPQYEFDLLRLLGKSIDYSTFTSKEKDQFFTPSTLVQQCWDIVQRVIGTRLSQYTCIEPSAGDGAFLDVLPETSIALDIEPRHPRVLKQDYLTWTPPNPDGKYIVIGNPPFGLRGHIALQFLNHSAAFADYVCFILPQLFESDGKGSPRKRVQGYNLIHSEKLSGMFRVPDTSDVEINGVFQIWAKHEHNPVYALTPPSHPHVTVYSLSDGGTPSTTRNKSKLTTCDIYLPSTCFGREAMRVYTDFEQLPGRKGYGVAFHENKDALLKKSKEIDWAAISFLSTNSALNLRTSLILKQFTQ